MAKINGEDVEAVNYWIGHVGQQLGDVYGDVVVEEAWVVLVNSNGYRVGKVGFSLGENREVTATYHPDAYGRDAD